MALALAALLVAVPPIPAAGVQRAALQPITTVVTAIAVVEKQDRTTAEAAVFEVFAIFVTFEMTAFVMTAFVYELGGGGRPVNVSNSGSGRGRTCHSAHCQKASG